MTDTFRDRFNLFLCSFTILFVELTCIRWISSYIRYLGYFTNFVLLASFLGIGLGILQARRRVDLHTFFPATLAVLVAIVATFKLQLNVTSGQEVFFQDGAIKAQGTEAFFLVPLVFILVGAIFALLGQNLGRLLTAVRPPLTAYTLDVAGSIAGSALFALISFLSAPPGVWFTIAALAALALPQRRGAFRVANAAILLGVVVWVTLLGRSSLWSPYYRIDVRTFATVAASSSSTTSATKPWVPTRRARVAPSGVRQLKLRNTATYGSMVSQHPTRQISGPIDPGRFVRQALVN